MNKSKYTKLYRIWHWTMALSTIGLLITVFLRETFLNFNENKELIDSKLLEKGIQISDNTSEIIVQTLRDNMWSWHYILGFVLLFSILIRFFMIITRQANIPIIEVFQAKNKTERVKKVVYTILCFLIMLMTVSGFAMYYGENFSFTPEKIEMIKELHENAMNGLILMIIIHIIGVLKHDFITKEGIISKIISGEK